MAIIMWLPDKILQAFDARTKVKVLVHEAYFDNGNTKPYYFVKIVNVSYETPITITHIWIKDEKEIDLINVERPLPYKLDKTDIWETWFPKDIIIDHANIFKNVYVILSNEKEYRSKKNKKVRPYGMIAGR